MKLSLLTAFFPAMALAGSLCPETVEFDFGSATQLFFTGFDPTVKRFTSSESKVVLKGYDFAPELKIKEGFVEVRAGDSCTPEIPPSEDPSSANRLIGFGIPLLFASATNKGIVGPVLALTMSAIFFGNEQFSVMASSSHSHDHPEDIISACSLAPITVEIYLPEEPEKTLGEVYMEDMISWTDYDGSDGSLHFDPSPGWSADVEASRKFRESLTGKDVYSYRSKVEMGMSQTRILHEPPFVTPKDDVIFDIPDDVELPDTDEGILMLSVLEMQGLLRSGKLTATKLTEIALTALKKYDPEYNMLEVELEDLAYTVAAEVDAMLLAEDYVSPIMGIPFAVKDTYDVKGYATAYGSFEFLDNVVESESPLVTYAVEAKAVPLFKSTVPQLTWGYANYNGTVYSCLNGGFAAGAGGSGGSSIGSGAAVCLGVVPVAICEQTGSSCQAPAIANGISTVIPALGTFSREGNGLYSMESDRPGLLCRDVMSCAVFYNYMRGTSPGDPQSRDVPFADPSKEDISTYTIGFSDNSDTQGWPEAWDTPFMGQRGNVVEKLEELGATVITKDALADFMEPTQLLNDYHEAGIGSKWFAWFDWYWLNVEGFFEGGVFNYGGESGSSYGPVWEGQNFNFDNGYHREHIGASAYAYLDDLWIFGYVAEYAMYPMLQTLPDVVVHFAQSELNGAHNGGMIKRAGINTVHIPEFYWNTTDDTFVDWVGSRPSDFYKETTVTAAMITCESKKYEPVKAFAVCYQLQQALVPGGKLVSEYKDIIHEALKSGEHDLDCPYDWSNKSPDYLEGYPDYLKDKVMSKMGNRGTIPTCGADTAGGCTGGTCSDVRLKYDIVPHGTSQSGVPIYKFKYRPGVFGADHTTTFIGAMAQDLVYLAPDAVCKHQDDGYLRVDYSKIDVDFVEA